MEEMKGIERIKQFSKETKDQNIKKVAEYLINREDMNDKFLNEEKNLTDMQKRKKMYLIQNKMQRCKIKRKVKMYQHIKMMM